MVCILRNNFIKIVLCMGMFIFIQHSAFSIQDPESDIKDSEFRIDYLSNPEIQSYVEFCRAIYWENMAEKNAMTREAIDSNREKALRYLKEAIKYNPNSSYLYSKLGRTLINMGQFREASSVIEKSLGLNPNNPEAHFLMGVLNFAQRDREGAVKEFKKATELKPEHFLAQFRLASILYEDGDYKGAAESYSEMVKMKPYDPDIRLRLAKSYSKANRIKDAIREFTNVTRLNEGNLDAHFHLAFLYARQSRTKEAIDECLFVLKSAPENPDMNLLLGELYISIGDFDDAISFLEIVLKNTKSEKSKLAEANYRLGTAYKGKNESSIANLYFRNSLEAYKIAMEKEKNNIGLNYDIAMVYDAVGDIVNAERYLRKHIELMPDEPNAYNFLGYMFVENNKNLPEAISLIKKAVELEPENGAFRDSLGWAYFKFGKIDQAIEELEKASKLLPSDSEVHIHLGEAYLKKGGDFTSKAISAWEKAIEIKPKNPRLQERLNELRSQ